MNRILFEEGEISGGACTFGGKRAEHVLNVLHGEPGQRLKTGVVDGLAGESAIESIERLGKDPATGLEQGRVSVRCSHTERTAEPWADVILAPPRPRAFKRLLPQLVQMGVGRIVLAGAEKVEKAFWGATVLKPENMVPLMVEGLMQAGTTALPEVSSVKNLARWIAGGGLEREFGEASRRIVAHPAPREAGARGSGAARGKGRTLIAIGPEGGWTDAEVEAFMERGFEPVSLGPQILRTDTAAVALMAIFMPRPD